MSPRFSSSLRGFCVVAVILAQTATLRPATNATAASVAAGTALLVPLGVTALTGSNIDVTVEVYVPSQNIPLGSSTVLHRLAQESTGTLTVGQAATLYTKIEEKLPTLNEGAARIRRSIAALKAISPPLQGTLPKVIMVYETRADWLEKVTAACQAYLDRYRDLRDSRTLNVKKNLGELTDVSLRVTRALEGNEAGYPPGITDLVALQLNGHVRPRTLMDAVKETAEWSERERFGHLLSVLLPARFNDGYDAKAIANFFGKLGFDIDASVVVSLKKKLSRAQALALFEKGSAIEMAMAAAEELSSTFNALTTSVNFGPLANEAIQQIFAADNEMLGALLPTNSDRWRPLNHARASGQGGDQNIVLYFENVLTPVLKSAKFDPSEFQAAAAALYKTGLSTAASLYGLPASGTAATSASPYNLPALTLRKQKLAGARTSWRDEQIDALKRILDKYEQLKASHIDATTDTWRGMTADEIAPHRTSAMTETKAMIASLATKLSPPAPEN